jgi:hypothetical protein
MFDDMAMPAAAAGAGTVLSALAMRLFERGARGDVNKLEKETEQLRKITQPGVWTYICGHQSAPLLLKLT